MTTSTTLRSERLAAVSPLRLLRQRMDALLEQVGSGSLNIDSILLQSDLDEVSGVLYVCKLVEVVPSIGKVKARQLLARMNVSETEQTGNLTMDQRNKLVQLIVSANRVQNGCFGYFRRFDRSRAIRSSISVTVSAKSSLIST